jgi:hypothetical protein
MLCRPKAMLPPPYQRPPGAECPALGFSVVLKILVKANLHLRVARWTWARSVGSQRLGRDLMRPTAADRQPSREGDKEPVSSR